MTVLSKGLRRLLRLRAGLAPPERAALEGSHAAVKGWLAAARRPGRPCADSQRLGTALWLEESGG